LKKSLRFCIGALLIEDDDHGPQSHRDSEKSILALCDSVTL